MHMFFALAVLAVSPALTAYAAAQPYDLNYQCSLVEQIKEFRERKAGKLLDVRRKDFLLGLTMVSWEGNDIVLSVSLDGASKMQADECERQGKSIFCLTKSNIFTYGLTFNFESKEIETVLIPKFDGIEKVAGIGQGVCSPK